MIQFRAKTPVLWVHSDVSTAAQVQLNVAENFMPTKVI